MSTVTPDPASLLGYQLRLPSFEGPLDVLLRLVERSQLAIADVSLIAVTQQFLIYVGELPETRPEQIAEFASVGARLVLLKSRSLLPRPPADNEESASDLTRELIEYRAVKLAAQQLAERDRRGDGAFARAAAGIALPGADTAPKLAMHEANWLARAIRRKLTAVQTPRPIVQGRPLVSLRTMVERVLLALDGHRTARFDDIGRTCADAHEVRTAFLAMLVLIRRRVVDVEQDSLFGEITIARAAVPVPLDRATNLELAEAS